MRRYTRPMNTKPLAVLLALTLPLAACGNKGPLVRPGTPARAHASPLGAPAPSEETAPPSDSTVAPPADSTVAPPADSTPPPAGNGHG